MKNNSYPGHAKQMEITISDKQQFFNLRNYITKVDHRSERFTTEAVNICKKPENNSGLNGIRTCCWQSYQANWKLAIL